MTGERPPQTVRGQGWMPRGVVPPPSADWSETHLTPRERDVCALLAAGYTQPQAAEVLHVSFNTIATLVKRARLRLEACNATHLVAEAIRRGEIT